MLEFWRLEGGLGVDCDAMVEFLLERYPEVLGKVLRRIHGERAKDGAEGDDVNGGPQGWANSMSHEYMTELWSCADHCATG